WTDGSALDYFNWAPGFPTYDPCVVEGSDGLWKTTNCGATYFGICLKAQPKCDFGWTQLAETSQCYLPGQAATHDDALAACRKMYARLTSIHTKSENDFIMALAPPSPVQQQCNPEAPYGIWTGGMAMNGYDSWADGTAFSYPNLYGNGDPSSGAIYLAAEPGCPDFGKWRVTPSKNLTLSYVCKKNPIEIPPRAVEQFLRCGGGASMEDGHIPMGHHLFTSTGLLSNLHPTTARQLASVDYDAPTVGPPTLAPTMGPISYQCPTGWSYFATSGACYWVGSSNTLDAARTTCKQVGSDLVSIHSSEENGFVLGLAFRYTQNCTKGSPWWYSVWTGGVASNGYNYWSDGTPFTYSNFYGHGDPTSGAIYLITQSGCTDFSQWRITPSQTVSLTNFVCK
ncbi:unnamed protein product, partial [Mesorhabditis spiculigera]